MTESAGCSAAVNAMMPLSRLWRQSDEHADAEGIPRIPRISPAMAYAVGEEAAVAECSREVDEETAAGGDPSHGRYRYRSRGDRPRVVHWRKEPFDVYIGRPNSAIHKAHPGQSCRWGNPFVVDRDGTRAQVLEKYRNWLLFTSETGRAACRERV